MAYQFTGTIKVIGETAQVSEKFQKREFVVTELAGNYPQDIMFQLVQDKCSALDSYKVGDVVEVAFNLKGRGWTNPQGEVKFFNSLEAWRVERAQGQTANTAPQAAPASASANTAPAAQAARAPQAQPQETIVTSTGDDDLPF